MDDREGRFSELRPILDEPVLSQPCSAVLLLNRTFCNSVSSGYWVVSPMLALVFDPNAHRPARVSTP